MDIERITKLQREVNALQGELAAKNNELRQAVKEAATAPDANIRQLSLKTGIPRQTIYRWKEEKQ